MRRYTGLGVDYVWEDLGREYGDLRDEPVRLRRSNAFRGSRIRRRGQALCSRAGLGPSSRPTVRLVEEPASDARPVAHRRSDSAQPKVVARGSGIRGPFADVVETAEEQAEMANWSEDCCADPQDSPRVQEVATERSPTFVQLARVQSQCAVFEHVDDAQSEVSDEEETGE